MSATNKTPNYELPVFIGTDKPSWLTDFNGAMNKIDTALHDLAESATSGVTKEYVDGQIETVTNSLSTLQTTVDGIVDKLVNFLTIGSSTDGITATQYDQIKVNE